jgi:hypothetical protein
MRAALRATLVLALLTGPIGDAQERSPRSAPATTPDGGWKTASAQSLGVDPDWLAHLTASVRGWAELGVHAILIERSGHLIYEEYFDGFDERWGTPLGRVSMTPETLHDLRSLTKSVGA